MSRTEREAMSTSVAISFSTDRSSSSRVMSRSMESLFAHRLTLSCSLRKPNTAATLTINTEISSAYMARLVLDIVSRWMSIHFLRAGRSIWTSSGTIISSARNEA